MTSRLPAKWHRVRHAAFVDDGQRVVVVNLGDPTLAKPMLLQGAAAETWRLLTTPATTEELVQALNSGSSVHHEMDGEKVDQLVSALCAAALIAAVSD